MRPRALGRPSRGFTLTDLLVSLAGVATVAALLLAPLLVAHRKARLTQCTANLGQVSRAILSFAQDHQHTLPGPDPNQPGEVWWSYKERVKSYAGLTGPSSPKDTTFACPDDRGYSEPKPFHQTARFHYSSYVLNAVTLPGLPSLAAWPLAAVREPSRSLLVMEWTAHAPLSWHHSRTGRRNLPFYCDARSVVGFVDGHVRYLPIYFDGYNAAYTRDPIAGYEYRYSGN